MQRVSDAFLERLTFRLITPDERTIPVEDLCKDPVRNVMRLKNDTHAYVLVQAVQPDGQLYWTQGFYMSSGANSSMPGVWLPMDGILKYASGAGFVNKLPYVTDAPPPRPIFRPGMKISPPKPRATILNKAGLLEGDTTQDRFGPTSMQMASKQLTTHTCDKDVLEGPAMEPSALTDWIRKYKATAVDRFEALGVAIEFPHTDAYDDHEAIFMGLTYWLPEFEPKTAGKRRRRKTRRQRKLSQRKK